MLPKEEINQIHDGFNPLGEKILNWRIYVDDECNQKIEQGYMNFILNGKHD